MYSNMMIALSAAMMLGAICIARANQTLNDGRYNSELGVATGEWIVQGDTWLRREELTGGPSTGKTSELATAPGGQSNLDPQIADPSRDSKQSTK